MPLGRFASISRRVLTALAVHAGLFAPVAADTVTGRLRVETTALQDLFSAASPEDALQPWLPVFVAIPPGHRVVAARAVVGGGSEAAIRIVGTAAQFGHALAHVQVARAAIEAAATAGVAEVVVEVETAPGGTLPLQRLRPDTEQAQREQAAVAQRVANPLDVARFAAHSRAVSLAPREAAIASSRSRGFRPSGDPSLDGSGVRYLIVTTEALAPGFAQLVEWKTRRGVPTAIRTIEWIESRTRRGVDRAETLRNFLAEAYQLWGIEYVLLGADSDFLPSRFAFSTIYGGGTAPADLYFACLDGTWNGDGDAVWGEGSMTTGLGESDMMPELAVSRAPVNDAAQVQVFVNRIIGYETPLFADYQDRATFLAEVLIPANWDSGQTISFNGSPGTEQMLNQSVPAIFTTQRLYDTYWSYPNAQRLTRSATLAAMNAGTGIVNHLGHGFRYTMSCGDASLVNSDADALVNAGRTFVLCMANCAAVAFDYNCLAEHFLLNPGGGAACVIGASRSVSASLIVTYNRAFHRQLFEFDRVHAGDLLNALRLERVGFAELDGSDRWIQFSLVALGDPEMPIFTAAVRPSELALADSIPVGPDTLDVAVTSSGSPVAGATVCAFKTDDVYAVATTDVGGIARLEIAPRTPGVLGITVSGANLAVDTTTVWVTPIPAPVVVLAGHAVDDDAMAPSAGNSSGGADAGETVELFLELRNKGTLLAERVAAAIPASGPGYTALAGYSEFGAVEPDSSVSATGAMVLQLDAGLADGTTIEIPVTIMDGEDRVWNERLRLLVCAPVAEVTRVTTTTTAPGQFTIAVEVKNLGSGPLGGLTATLAAVDSTAIASVDSTAWSAIPPLASATGSPAFAVVDTSASAVAAQVDFVDGWGRTFALAIDGVAPAPPPVPVGDVSWGAGTVRLTWTPSAAPDHLGYHVFRSSPGSPEFVRITQDMIVHSDYYDRDVTPNTHYEYYIVAVDASRQWSEPSPTLGVDTIAASVAGWPTQVAEPTASSVAVGDIDGDGGVEVVVGDLGVYAWRASALEVVDGDNDATTDGVFSLAPGTLTASVALAELNGALGLEIVGASWLTNKIFVWDGHGQLLPGWPQEPQSGGNTGYWSSPAVGEIDGQAPAEIVAISKDGNLYAWHADGTPLLGSGNGAVRSVGAWTQTTPALADLDGDGRAEIITSGSLARVDVTRWDGSDFPGWPQSLFALGKGSPAVGDIDGNGDLEIVITSESDHIYVFNADGTLLPGWPRSLPGDSPDLGPSPALGDLDDDGRLEIVAVGVKNPFPQTKLYVFDADGDIVLEKQLELNAQSSPILVDVDGDGGVDIVHGGEAGVLHAWDATGNELTGFPIPVGDYIRSTPQYCDLDSDGYGDLVFAGWDRSIYAWRLAGRYRPHRAPWPAFHGNVAHTGFLAGDYPTSVGETPPPARFGAAWSPNPFNPTITVRLAIPGSVPVPVRVDLFDARGRRVRRLVDEILPPGAVTRTWDGRDDRGHTLPSGVYVYRADAASQVTRGKLTLVR